MLDKLRDERKDQSFNYWLQLERALAKVDPKAPPCHKTNPYDYTKWCDSKGPGGFMGHVCKSHIKGPDGTIYDGGKWPIVPPFHYSSVSEIGNWPKIEPTDKINHPAHYGGDTVYEAIKVIDAWELGFELGCTTKYIKRSGKDQHGEQFLAWELAKRIEDLKKAEWYLHHKIEQLQNKLEDGQKVGPISDVRHG